MHLWLAGASGLDCKRTDAGIAGHYPPAYAQRRWGY